MDTHSQSYTPTPVARSPLWTYLVSQPLNDAWCRKTSERHQRGIDNNVIVSDFQGPDMVELQYPIITANNKNNCILNYCNKVKINLQGKH